MTVTIVLPITKCENIAYSLIPCSLPSLCACINGKNKALSILRISARQMQVCKPAAITNLLSMTREKLTKILSVLEKEWHP